MKGCYVRIGRLREDDCELQKKNFYYKGRESREEKKEDLRGGRRRGCRGRDL